jgi:transcriptional regulator with XRE-family HTH domain
VRAERTNRGFREEVERLRQEQGLSLRALAERAGVSHPYLSRLLRQADYKKNPSLRVAAAVAAALGKPRDYFGEYREAYIIQRIQGAPRLRDRMYDSLRK